MATDIPQQISVEDQISALGLEGKSAEAFRKLGDSDRAHLLVHLTAGALIMQTGKSMMGNTNIVNGDTQAVIVDN